MGFRLQASGFRFFNPVAGCLILPLCLSGITYRLLPAAYSLIYK
jgi:hypothetical protein